MVLKQVRRNVETQFKSRNLSHVLETPGALRYCFVVPPSLSSAPALKALTSAAKVAGMPIFPFVSQDAALASAWATKTCGPLHYSEYEAICAARAEARGKAAEKAPCEEGGEGNESNGDGTEGAASSAATAASEDKDKEESSGSEEMKVEKEEKPKTFGDWVRRETEEAKAGSQSETSPLHRVLFVDCGHTYTSAFVFDVREDCVVSLSSSSVGVGARSFDQALYVHFSSKLAGEHFAGDETKVSPKTKAGGKILKASRKLKHLLSTIAEAKVGLLR